MRGRSCAAVAVGLLIALPSAGHDVQVDLEFWGGFPDPRAVRCQRAITRAATLCVARSIATRASCFDDAVDGFFCDEGAAQARAADERARAVALIGRRCSDELVQSLSFSDVADVQQDVDAACRAVEQAALSAFYGPAITQGAVSELVDPADRACVKATGRFGARALRRALRIQHHALGHIAARDMTPAEKQSVIDLAAGRTAQALAMAGRRLGPSCAASGFRDTYGREAATLLETVAGQAGCVAESATTQGELTCPIPFCGNAMQESPLEACDDGNAVDGDGCDQSCRTDDCDAFDGTFALIQQAIFENKECTNAACHGSAAQQGGLDLTPGVAYGNLIDAASSTSAFPRIEPGSPLESYLWLKLAAATYPDDYADQIQLAAMPSGFPALSPDELEAVRIWILDGAPKN